jgi:ABC-type branched-subunit amino acid transport system substrate-binding protein
MLKGKMEKLLIIVKTILIFTLFCFSFISCKKSKKVIVIGVLTNLEGSNSELTITAYKAIKLAYKEVLKNNKFIKIKFIAIDESFNPEKIKKSYNILKKKKCDVIMVMTTSTAFLSVYKDVLENKDVLHFIVGPSTSKISNKNDNIIRNGIDSINYQKKIAEFLNPKVKKLFVIQEYEKNKGYTDPAYKKFSKFYNGIIEHAKFSALKLDFEDIIKKFKNFSFKYVYIIAGSTPRSVGILIQKLQMIKPGIKIVVLSWVWGNVLKEAMGKYNKNVIVSYPFNISKENSNYHSFRKKMYMEFKASPNNYSNLTYDAAKILFQSIAQTKTSKINILKKEILSNSYAGNSGKIVFTKFGDTIGDIYFYKIDKNGLLKMLNND